jgi:hypothetical protein
VWTLWTPDRVAARGLALLVDGAPVVRSSAARLPGMSIEMPAAEVHALAASLLRSSDDADQIGVRLSRPASVGGDLEPAVHAFLDGQRATGQALAGELRWLGATIAGVADAWLRLDAVMVRPHGAVRAE